MEYLDNSYWSHTTENSNNQRIMPRLASFQAKNKLNQAKSSRYEEDPVKRVKPSHKDDDTWEELDSIASLENGLNQAKRKSQELSVQETEAYRDLAMISPNRPIEFNFRQYELQGNVQKTNLYESLNQQATEKSIGNIFNLNCDYNAQSRDLLNIQQTDKNLSETTQASGYDLLSDPVNSVTRAFVSPDGPLQTYLKEKQQKFDSFMKKMEEILNLCSDQAVDALESKSEEEQEEDNKLKIVPNNKTTGKRRVKNNKKN